MHDRPHLLLAVSLLTAAVATSGCARRPAATPMETGAASAPAADPAANAPAPPPAAPPLDAKEQRYREAVRKQIVDTTAIQPLIRRKPVLGGSWRVGSPEAVHFLGDGKVAIDYEDGHVTGRLTVHVDDPHDLKTWTVLRDEPGADEG
jgi:hypothetical protein